MPRDSEVAPVDLPAFGMPDAEPGVPAAVYRDRLDRLRERAREAGYDAFVVYGDREHFANIAYLTGYDPRFEEALLVLGDGAPALVVGNEGEGYVDTSPVADEFDVQLFQSFSLLGQDRSASPGPREMLRRAGVGAGDRVGVAGWKHFTAQEVADPATTLEVPAYLAGALRELAGDRPRVENANALLMDSSEGMRATSGVDQLARFEFAACHTSRSVWQVLDGVEPGMTEHEAVQLMAYTGIPLSCHLMLSAGERAWMGLPSPTTRTIERGDPLTTAYGNWGALNARAGWVVEGRAGLPEGVRDYVEVLVAPYFEAIAEWYDRLAIGVEGRRLYDAVHDTIGDPFFGVELNPGHLIHLDEWVDSPVYEGSTEQLRSGMAVQADVIPATGTDYFTTNVEDTVALADRELRRAFADRYPGAWDRVQARRQFMQGTLGFDLAPEVLPFSNIPGYLPPYLLSPERAMVLAG
ncbi:MAG: aminopeptidase P family N-terminal domain-containing protein [Halobacteriaceae archaeon]